MRRKETKVVLAVVVGVIGLCRGAAANHIVMTVDPSQSQVVLSGSDTLYGPGMPQASGSNVSTVDGHFLVDFDASSGAPTSIQFFGGHGSSAYELTNGGANFQPSNLPANFALKDSTGTSTLAIRDLSWDWSSGSVPVDLSGQFASSSMHFTTLSGTEDVENSNLGNQSYSATGISDNLDSGTSTLTQGAPGAWQLELNFHYSHTSTISGVGITTEGLTTNYNGTIVATAQFGADNITLVNPDISTQADVLGGASQVGGVSATFIDIAAPGHFSAQQIPAAGLSTDALAAGAINPVFALSAQGFSVAPQIWDVQYDGDLEGTYVTLTFHYDPNLLPVGIDESQLGIWHYSAFGAWEFGGTVNTADHTITYTTDSFSPFELGVSSVPEPSTMALLGLGIAVLVGVSWRKRDRSVARLSG